MYFTMSTTTNIETVYAYLERCVRKFIVNSIFFLGHNFDYEDKIMRDSKNELPRPEGTRYQ